MTAHKITLGFVGDLMLGRGVSEMAAQYSPESFWGDVLPLLHDCDAVFGNLESPITTRHQRWNRCWKAFRFRAHPRVIDLLKVANIRFVSLANNHILDCEEDGLFETIQHLDAAGIAHAGAGRDLCDARRPKLMEIAGLRVGAMSLTDTMREYSAKTDRAGTWHLPIRTDTQTLSQIEQAINELRSAGADVTVLSVHWGANLRPWPSKRFRRFARAVSDLGVDVFHGHSAHLFHGIEARESKLILYDTGDILDDYWVFPGIRTDRSCIFLTDFVDGILSEVRLVPVLLERGRVRRAVGKEAHAIASKILRSSIVSPDVDPAMTAEIGLKCPNIGSAQGPVPIEAGRPQSLPLPQPARTL